MEKRSPGDTDSRLADAVYETEGLDPIMRHLNPLHTSTHCFLNIHSRIAVGITQSV
jgi:hypothetical protein